MLEISVKEARSNLSALLDKVERGEEIVITRHGKHVARLLPPSTDTSTLPGLAHFRASIQIKGQPLSQTVIELRNKERY